MTVLSTLSSDLASAVASVGPNVVQVEARRGVPASGTIWTTEGIVVTANHAVVRDEDIKVVLADGKSAVATLIGRDPTTDLALLRLENGNPASSKWIGAGDLRVGHLVLSLGRPGKTVRAALGIISALGESWRTPAGGTVDSYIQTDAPSYPGFSGGPLATVEGDILGIGTSGLLRGTTVTVPTTTVKAVVDELLKRGRISRGYLGVGIQPVRLPSALGRQLGQETALLVVSVEPDSPGERAGLVLGDTIIAIGNSQVRHWDDLLGALGKDEIGKTVTVRILRGGQSQQLKATIGERP